MIHSNILIIQQEEIQKNVSMYIPEISSILNSIPRQMLLLLKTNDLLRSIEFALHSQKSASSFISMSKCCVRALGENERRQCNGWFCSLKVGIRQQARLLAISVYEVYTWLITTAVYRWISRRTLMSQIISWESIGWSRDLLLFNKAVQNYYKSFNVNATENCMYWGIIEVAIHIWFVKIPC